MTHLTVKAGHSLTKLLVLVLCAQVALLCYDFYSNYKGRQDLVTAQRAGCERGKRDRAANAEFQRAHTIYITGVTDAPSVHKDVKELAKTAVEVYRRTSAVLTKQSHIDCTKAFPKASLLP